MALVVRVQPAAPSLANAAGAVGEQIWCFVDAGFFDLHTAELELELIQSHMAQKPMHTAIPFAPVNFMPSAAATKKGSGKWRRTADGGTPRQDLLDGEGTRAISINEGIGLKLQNDGDPTQYHGHNRSGGARSQVAGAGGQAPGLRRHVRQLHYVPRRARPS